MNRAHQAASLAGSIDFAIITMREDEFRAVLRYFPPRLECRGRRTYDIAEFEAANGLTYRAALVRTAEQGHLAAQAAASDLIVDLAPAWVVLVGIGGAVPETEFSLGDVVLATRLHDFSLTAAIAGGRIEFDVRGGPAHRAVQDLIVRLPALESRLGDWNAPSVLGANRPPVAFVDEAFKGDEAWQMRVRQGIAANFGTPALAQRAPRAVAAAMASGNVLMKDPAVLERWLTESARSIKTIEMELPGVYEAARSAAGDIPVLAVRGISDVVGFRRDPSWTAYACATAASFTAALLSLGLFDPREKPEPLGEQTPARPEGTALAAHLDRVRNWSAQVQFSMMPAARDVESQTIPLSFSGTPRKFRRERLSSPVLTEANLLDEVSHALIQGTPGAGKTTTVKRLCRAVLADVRVDGGLRRTPMLIRLRDCNRSADSLHPVLVKLADDLGLEPRVEEIVTEHKDEAGRMHKSTTKITVCRTGQLEHAVPDSLNQLRAIVFLDGSTRSIPRCARESKTTSAS
jgi:nucleoside phosphorylase